MWGPMWVYLAAGRKEEIIQKNVHIEDMTLKVQSKDWESLKVSSLIAKVFIAAEKHSKGKKHENDSR